jgi:flagellar protein FliO/FliZ
MFDAIYYLAVVLVLACGLFGLIFVLRKQLAGGGGLQSIGLFGPKPDRRLGVVEHASVDGKRRLILVRRDNVEHLIMTGGPVDVVIETGIMPQSVPSSVEHDLAALTDEPFPRTPPGL